jgi:hypothetical protein
MFTATKRAGTRTTLTPKRNLTPLQRMLQVITD